jgi:hypothetical protein
MTSDPLTNATLVTWYLDSILSPLGIETINKIYTSFGCGTCGYSLCAYPDIGRLYHIQQMSKLVNDKVDQKPTSKPSDTFPYKREVITGILYQLVSTLHILNGYGFSHGQPSSRAMLYDSEPVSYTYDGCRVSSPLSLKLANMEHASVTVKGTRGSREKGRKDKPNIRLYQHCPIIEHNLRNIELNNIVTLIKQTPLDINYRGSRPITYFRLSPKLPRVSKSSIYDYVKYIGAPIYQTCYDLYAFLIILLSDKSFYDTFMLMENIRVVWEGLWLPAELDRVNRLLIDIHDKADPMTKPDHVFDFIQNFYLRCDAIEYTWTALKRLQ